jgi:flagellum-specific ATP synthase
MLPSAVKSSVADCFVTDVARLNPVQFYGKVSSVVGMLIEIKGNTTLLSVGDRCRVYARNNSIIPLEIIGFKGDVALAIPYTTLDGIGLGNKVLFEQAAPVVYPSDAWLGRVINAFGDPIDEQGSLLQGTKPQAIKANPPPSHARGRVGKKLNLGVRALNIFLTCCVGQRLGIFAGSGVGKSTMMSMFAKFTEADVVVIGLIGERGREVQEFIEDDLGEEGMKKSVLVVATSDESPLMRRQAAYMTLTVAEYFRDQGKNVLCLMDSVTRFAMAQREIGLSAGEPPTSKGYTPTVFTELAKLLERAGPGLKGSGSITGLFSVLVEGDDTNEPIADATRGILDGHIVLERKIAERGRYPAINILKSISRSMPDCNTLEETKLINRARGMLAAYENMAELIRLGAYKKGTDAAVDESIDHYPLIEDFLTQATYEQSSFDEGYERLAEIITPKRRETDKL